LRNFAEEISLMERSDWLVSQYLQTQAYVFYVFFQISEKNMTLRFLNDLLKGRKMSLAKV